MIKEKKDINQVKEKVLQLYPTDEKFKQSFCDKSMKAEQSNKKARYILARLEEYLNKSSIDETALTVEHILPLKPKDYWKNSLERIGICLMIELEIWL